MSDLMDIADKIVGWANDDEQVEAFVARGRDTEIEVYEGEIETFSSADSLGVGVRVVRDGREGFAYAATFDDEALAEALAEARDNAGFAEPDEWNGLATPDGVAEADIDPWDERLTHVSTEDKVAMAMELEKATRSADARVRAVEAAGYGDGFSERAIATTTGIRAEQRRSDVGIYVVALAGPAEATQTGYAFSAGRHVDELDLDRVAREGADQAVRMLGATKPATQRATVVLDPRVTSQFLGILSSTLNGMAVLKGRSLFADRVGHEVAAASVTLADDPTDLRTRGASRQDGEGLACRRTELIRDGVLQGFIHNTYTGRRSGMGTTASATRGFKSGPGVGCRSLLLAPGTMTTEEVLAAVGDGVLIQSVKGLHSGVNPISGDFSTGADGLVIRDGALAEPIKEFTIASTLQKMLLGISVIGGDVDFGLGVPGMSLAIGDITISGT